MIGSEAIGVGVFRTWTSLTPNIGSMICNCPKKYSMSEASASGRFGAGACPTAETMADRLVNSLDGIAEREPAPERKGRPRKSATYLGNAGRDLVVEIGATAINRRTGT